MEFLRKSVKRFPSLSAERKRARTRKWEQAHPERAKNIYKRNDMFSLQFLGRKVRLSFIPKRTGHCFKCGRSMTYGTCKPLHLHHYFYCPCMPWTCMIELCASCHKQEDWKIGRHKYAPWNKGKKFDYKPRSKMKGKVPWNKGIHHRS